MASEYAVKYKVGGETRALTVLADDWREAKREAKNAMPPDGELQTIISEAGESRRYFPQTSPRERLGGEYRNKTIR